jgi:cytochrome c oxidase subunit 4
VATEQSHGHKQDHHDDHGHGYAHIASVKVLVGTFGALICMTILTVVIAKGIDLGPSMNLAIAMAIATIKATLVVLFFMHLKYDKVFHSVLLIGGLMAAALFVGFALMDRGQYQDTVIWDTRTPPDFPNGPKPLAP